MNNKKIFISFSSKQQDEAVRVCEFLEANGFPCFISLRDLIAGEEYAAQLIDNLGESQAVVLLMSKEANDSPHVLREVEYAVSKKIPILVYTLEDVKLSKSMEYFLTTHQWIPNVSNKDARLLAGLKHISEKQTDNGIPVGGAGIQASHGAQTPQPSIAPKSNETAFSSKQAKKGGSSNTLKMVCIIVAVFLALAIVVFAGLKLFGPKAGIATSSTVQKLTMNSFQLGSELTFGSYNNAPIDWYVIHKNDDGTVVLLAKNILSLKPFDAAEGGVYNSYEGVDYWKSQNANVEDDELSILIRGNNDWSVSNLRTWLNSDTNVVAYKDQTPGKVAVGDMAYDEEPGFLTGFTDSQKQAIIPTTHTSTANSLSLHPVDGKVTTVDSVYLLSSDELIWLDEADVSFYAVPVENINDVNNMYRAFSTDYGYTSYYWWLRDNPNIKANEAYIILTEYEAGSGSVTYTGSVGGSSYGVRPAITVDPKALMKAK